MDPLALVSDLRVWARDPGIDDALAWALLSAASGVVRAETGQVFTAVSGDTVVLDGVDEQWLTLPQRPVTAVSSVAVNGTALAATDWTLSGNRLFRRYGWLGRSWSQAPTLVTITYDHGYATIPDDVKAATCAIAAELLANPQGLTDEQIDDYRWRRDAGTESVADTLLASLKRTYRGTARTVRLAK